MSETLAQNFVYTFRYLICTTVLHINLLNFNQTEILDFSVNETSQRIYKTNLQGTIYSDDRFVSSYESALAYVNSLLSIYEPILLSSISCPESLKSSISFLTRPSIHKALILTSMITKYISYYNLDSNVTINFHSDRPKSTSTPFESSSSFLVLVILKHILTDIFNITTNISSKSLQLFLANQNNTADLMELTQLFVSRSINSPSKSHNTPTPNIFIASCGYRRHYYDYIKNKIESHFASKARNEFFLRTPAQITGLPTKPPVSILIPQYVTSEMLALNCFLQEILRRISIFSDIISKFISRMSPDLLFISDYLTPESSIMLSHIHNNPTTYILPHATMPLIGYSSSFRDEIFRPLEFPKQLVSTYCLPCMPTHDQSLRLKSFYPNLALIEDMSLSLNVFHKKVQPNSYDSILISYSFNAFSPSALSHSIDYAHIIGLLLTELSKYNINMFFKVRGFNHYFKQNLFNFLGCVPPTDNHTTNISVPFSQIKRFKQSKVDNSFHYLSGSKVYLTSFFQEKKPILITINELGSIVFEAHSNNFPVFHWATDQKITNTEYSFTYESMYIDCRSIKDLSEQVGFLLSS